MTRNQNLVKNDNIGTDHKPSSWFPISEIAKGDVSTVFRVTDSEGKIEAAMKVEKLRKGSQKKHIEKEILEALRDSPHSIHLLDYSFAGLYRITVMTLAGPTLGVIKNLMHNKFSDSTIIRLAIRTLMAIKDLHEHCFLHRDLEPGNIALSACKSSRNLYLLDFGEARQFARNDNGKWILRTPREKVPFRGSVQYCSPKMHDMEDLGRVDDLWSWLYIFIEMRIYLPWTDSTFPFKYGPRKRTLLDETLHSDPFLSTFLPVVTILKAAKFADRPDYFKIYEILAAKMTSMGVKWTDPMDYDIQTERLEYFSKNLPNEEKMTEEQISAVFQEVIVPGGAQYVLPPDASFFAIDKEVKSKLKEKEKEKEKDKEKEKEKEKPKDKEKVREKEKEKERKTGSQEKTTERTSDTPSKNVDMKSRKKTVKTLPPIQKHTKTSSTSSVSRQTPPSPIDKPPPPPPPRALKKKPNMAVVTKLKCKT